MGISSSKRKRRPLLEDNRRAGPGRPRSPIADRAILKAALKLFVERGYEGAAIEQIAYSAGVARTTVYRRWASRDALIAEAIAQERGLAEQAVMTGGTSPQAKAEAVINALVEIFTAPNYRKIMARLIGSVPDHPQLMSIYWNAYLVPRRRVAAALLDRAREDGLIGKDTDPAILLDLIGGAVVHRLLVDPVDCSPAELRAYLFKMMGALGLDPARGRKLERDMTRRHSTNPGADGDHK